MKQRIIKCLENIKKNPVAYMWRMIAIWGSTMIAMIVLGIFLEPVSYTVSKAIPAAEAEVKVSKLEVLVGTPMEDAIPFIKRASAYFGVYEELYLGIANAESSFKQFPKDSFNPFGIKPNNELKSYGNWEQSINGFSQLIRYYYLDDGKITCEQIMPKYVGYNSPEWIANCKKFYNPQVTITVN